MTMSASRQTLRAWGLAIAVASVILPSLPFGPLFAQPPMPLAVLWAAYGWAAEDESNWRAPTTLFLLGLVHDQLSGGPFGLFCAIYLFAFLIGRVFAVLMSAPNLFSIWAGFAATALITVCIAAVLAPWALGANEKVIPYAQAAAVTALLFPIVRPLYMSGGASQRSRALVRR